MDWDLILSALLTLIASVSILQAIAISAAMKGAFDEYDPNIYLVRNSYPKKFKAVLTWQLQKRLLVGIGLLLLSAIVYTYQPIEVYL